MTTTGFASVDYVVWPTLATMAIIGADVRRRLGGLDERLGQGRASLLLGKVLRRELRQTVHPEEVMPIRFNGDAVDERTVRAVIAFVLLYIGLFVVGAGVIAIDAAPADVDLASRTPSQPRRRRSGTSGRASESPGRWDPSQPLGDLSTLVMGC